MSAPTQPMRFPLGQIVATPGALAATSDPYRLECLFRHVSGDFGCVYPDDAESNRAGIMNGDRILSAYPIDPLRPSRGFGDNTFWIITEADRSVTTFLLPEEY